jgi:hypothetical protein
MRQAFSDAGATPPETGAGIGTRKTVPMSAFFVKILLNLLP